MYAAVPEDDPRHRLESRHRGFGGGPLDELRQAEVEDLHAPVAGDHDVRRLDVAVDDAGRVCGLERRSRLNPVLERSCQRQRPFGEHLVERRAVNELHRNEGRPFVLADFVDGDDVGMVERRSGAGFLDEAAMPLGIAGGVRLKEPDGGAAAEPGIDGAIDDPHAAASDFVLDLIVRDDHQEGLCHLRRGRTGLYTSAAPQSGTESSARLQQASAASGQGEQDNVRLFSRSTTQNSLCETSPFRTTIASSPPRKARRRAPRVRISVGNRPARRLRSPRARKSSCRALCANRLPHRSC